MRLAKKGWNKTTPVPESRPEHLSIVKTDDDLRYIITNNKVATEKFKGFEGYRLDELEDEPEIAMLIPDGITMLDFDNEQEANILIGILRDKGIETRIMKTDRGIHTYWKTPSPWKNNNGIQLRCGLEADIKSYGKSCYDVVRKDNRDRELINDVPLFSVPTCPAWLYPAPSTAKPLFGLKEGENGGRNGALSHLTMALQPLGVPKQDIIEIIKIANRYVIAEPLPQSDIESILRDESFRVEEIYRDEQGQLPWFEYSEKGKVVKFLHNVLGDCLTERIHVLTVHNQMYSYRDGYYQEGVEVIEQEILKLFNSSSIRQRAEVIKYLKIATRVESLSQLKQDEYIVNVLNGRLNILTGELTPHTPDVYDFHQLPIMYDPEAKSTVLDETLETVMDADPERIALLEEAIGYCFVRSCKFRKGFILSGSGKNGKSTMLEMIKRLLGKENTSTIEMDKLNDKFKTAELENKLLNVSDDTAYTAITDTGTLKKLFTGEGVTVERKNERPFTLENRAKLFIACNRIPKIMDTTEGMYSRLAIIPFEHVFEDTDSNNDKDILEKLTTPEAKSRLFNRAISGVQRLVRQNKFTTSSKVETAIRQYKESQGSPVDAWIDEEELTRDDLMTVSIADLFDNFKDWAVDAREKVDWITRRKFSIELVEKYKFVSTNVRVGEKQMRYFR